MSSGNSTTSIGNSAECNRRKKRILHSSLVDSEHTPCNSIRLFANEFGGSVFCRLDTANYNEMKKCKANSNRTSASNSPRRPESPLETLGRFGKIMAEGNQLIITFHLLLVTKTICQRFRQPAHPMVPTHRPGEAAAVVVAVVALRLLLLLNPMQNSNQRPLVMKHPYRNSTNRY